MNPLAAVMSRASSASTQFQADNEAFLKATQATLRDSDSATAPASAAK